MRFWKRARIIVTVPALVVGLLLVAHAFAAGQKRQARRPPDVSAAKAKAIVNPNQRQTKHKEIPGNARETLELAMKSYCEALSVIANNIANAETAGYKNARPILEDMPYRHETVSGVQDSAGQYSPASRSIGSGSRVAAIQIDFRQGRLRQTGCELDLAFEGDGLFQVKDASGEIFYCRAGRFVKNRDGNLAIRSADSCRLLEPPITIPADTTAISISPEGIVSVKQSGSNQKTQVGTIELACFVNPEGLERKGENLFAETDGSGPPTLGSPGQGQQGKIRQGWIESSNVDLDDEIREWKRVQHLCREIRLLLAED